MLLALVFLASGVIGHAQHEQHQPPAKPTGSHAGSRLPAPGSRIPGLAGSRFAAGGNRAPARSPSAKRSRWCLTCAVYEADNAQVVPDESRLGVASIQMAPFEILGGAHPPDVRRGSRRFFQYDYQLRIISPDAIGHDVNIPPLAISYRIHSRVGAAATLEGRDLSYVMPMMPIKVLSLVPADAADIRDASEASLGAVDSLRFRSSLFRVLTLDVRRPGRGDGGARAGAAGAPVDGRARPQSANAFPIARCSESRPPISARFRRGSRVDGWTRRRRVARARDRCGWSRPPRSISRSARSRCARRRRARRPAARAARLIRPIDARRCRAR